MKGIVFELSVDGSGVVGNTVSGQLRFNDIKSVPKAKQICEATPETDVATLVLNSFDTICGAIPSDHWHQQTYDTGSIVYEYGNSTFMQGNGAMNISYVVEQSESWGGLVALVHISNQSYNLAGASQISFWYYVDVPASPAGRTHMRFIILDGADCVDKCDEPTGSTHERYYSSHKY